MPIEEVRTIEELLAAPLDVCNHVRETGRPLRLSGDGKEDLILMDATLYEEKLSALNLAKLIAEAEVEIRAGRTRPAREFFAELRRGQKVPAADQPSR